MCIFIGFGGVLDELASRVQDDMTDRSMRVVENWIPGQAPSRPFRLWGSTLLGRGLEYLFIFLGIRIVRQTGTS